MRRVEFRENVIALFIFSIIVCSVCLEHVPARTTVYQGAANTISSDVRMEESKMSHAICGERFSQRAEARSLVRSAGRRIGGVTKFSFLGMLFREFFSQAFPLSATLRNYGIDHIVSGHIRLLRCIYRKDGKKDPFII